MTMASFCGRFTDVLDEGDTAQYYSSSSNMSAAARSSSMNRKVMMRTWCGSSTLLSFFCFWIDLGRVSCKHVPVYYTLDSLSARLFFGRFIFGRMVNGI